MEVIKFKHKEGKSPDTPHLRRKKGEERKDAIERLGKDWNIDEIEVCFDEDSNYIYAGPCPEAPLEEEEEEVDYNDEDPKS